MITTKTLLSFAECNFQIKTVLRSLESEAMLTNEEKYEIAEAYSFIKRDLREKKRILDNVTEPGEAERKQEGSK